MIQGVNGEGVDQVVDAVKVEVINRGLQIGSIRILGVGSSSTVLIGDTEVIANSSIFDTPPESLIIGPLVPFAPEAGS